MHIEIRKISLLDVGIKKLFEEKVNESVDVGNSNFCAHFKIAVLSACDEVCWKKMGKRCK